MPPSKKRTQPKASCLCGCKEPVYCRGLALSCYHATRRLVNSGQVSWDWLVENGDAAPFKKQSDRVYRNPHAKRILSKRGV